MTTSVTVTTHDWEVEVKAVDTGLPHEMEHHSLRSTTIVPRNSAATFYVHSDQDLQIHEVPNK